VFNNQVFTIPAVAKLIVSSQFHEVLQTSNLMCETKSS